MAMTDQQYGYNECDVLFFINYLRYDDMAFIPLNKDFLDILKNETFYNRYATPTQYDGQEYSFELLSHAILCFHLSVHSGWIVFIRLPLFRTKEVMRMSLEP
uniref:Phage protein n=1 Tax=Heterorhabditis bacteriophora TaxID=37862 RepID=A0A1I7WWR7_HETBA